MGGGVCGAARLESLARRVGDLKSAVLATAVDETPAFGIVAHRDRANFALVFCERFHRRSIADFRHSENHEA